MINDFSVDMNEYLPLRDVVFNTLRKAILKGELKPGERLMEIALAERLGVSRTPVREAMRKLELEGLVVMIPRRGAQVANITEKDLNDVLEVRIALENLSIENACARMTEEQLAELWKAAKDFEATMAEGNLVKLAEADVAFHEVIYKSSDNRRLNQVLNNLREQIYRYRVEYLKDEETRNLLVKEHEEIYEAIRNRDVKLKPGERLMEIALAERLGVSRTPVREAMRKLELEGLVVMIPRRGAQVANITEKDLNDVLEVRIALENLSIENACARMTEEQLAELWKAAKDFEATMAEGNLVKLAEADVAFHEVIYKSSDNRRLNQVLNNLREQIYRYRVEYLKDEETRNLLVKEHEEIYEAIRNRDVKQAQEISYQHIENQREAIIRSIREETQNRQVHK